MRLEDIEDKGYLDEDHGLAASASPKPTIGLSPFDKGSRLKGCSDATKILAFLDSLPPQEWHEVVIMEVPAIRALMNERANEELPDK